MLLLAVLPNFFSLRCVLSRAPLSNAAACRFTHNGSSIFSPHNSSANLLADLTRVEWKRIKITAKKTTVEQGMALLFYWVRLIGSAPVSRRTWTNWSHFISKRRSNMSRRRSRNTFWTSIATRVITSIVMRVPLALGPKPAFSRLLNSAKYLLNLDWSREFVLIGLPAVPASLERRDLDLVVRCLR